MHVTRASTTLAPPAYRLVSARPTYQSLRVHCVEQLLVEDFTAVIAEIFQLLQAKVASASTGKGDKPSSSPIGTSELLVQPQSALDMDVDGDTPTGVGIDSNGEVHEGATPILNPTNDQSTLSTDGGLETLDVDRRDSVGLHVSIGRDADCATENGSQGCDGASRWLESPQIFVSKVLQWVEEAVAAQRSNRGGSKGSERGGLPKPPKRTMPSQ